MGEGKWDQRRKMIEGRKAQKKDDHFTGPVPKIADEKIGGGSCAVEKMKNCLTDGPALRAEISHRLPEAKLKVF